MLFDGIMDVLFVFVVNDNVVIVVNDNVVDIVVDYVVFIIVVATFCYYHICFTYLNSYS